MKVTINAKRTSTECAPASGLIIDYHSAMNLMLKNRGYSECSFGTASSFAFRGYDIESAVNRVISLRECKKFG